MSTKRLWAIAGSVLAAIAVLVIVANVFGPTPPTADAEPTRQPMQTASPGKTASPSPSAIPAPAYTPPGVPTATCENTATAAFRAEMTDLGWTPSEGTAENSPFSAFPNGEPSGALTCLWSADHNVGTDNVSLLAWAPIDPEEAVAAMFMLESEGFVRTDLPEGVYLSVKGEPGWADDEGWGVTYYFGIDDVRWAATKADVDAHVKAPAEAD